MLDTCPDSKKKKTPRKTEEEEDVRVTEAQTLTHCLRPPRTGADCLQFQEMSTTVMSIKVSFISISKKNVAANKNAALVEFGF